MMLLEANNKNDLNPVLLTIRQPAAPVEIEAVTNGMQLLKFQLSESACFHDFVKATEWIVGYRDKINHIPPDYVT